MNKYDNKMNSVLLIAILGIIACFIKDFISIRNYNATITGNDEKFYSGILLDGYNCSQYSVIQVKFKWTDFDCGGYNPDSIVLNIKDKTKELDNYVCDDEIEEFYRDSLYRYYFKCKKSEYVVVYYNNNYSESIKSALKNGRISLADLDTYNIEYTKERLK